MKLGLVQLQPAKGDIAANIARHINFIEMALAQGANFIVFPELSLTGYEPALAKKLAIKVSDERLAIFQTYSDERNITIAVGAPVMGEDGVLISMLIFQPGQLLLQYSKQYLHEDELPFFVNGTNQVFIQDGNTKIAPAICYELSIPEHVRKAVKGKANVYLVSVAKSAIGIERASQTLTEIARNYNMSVILCNSIGPCDDFVSAGNSSVWNPRGELLASLDAGKEGVLIYDTARQQMQGNTLYKQ